MTRTMRRGAPFVTAITALALAACGGEAPPQADPSTASAPASTPTSSSTSEKADRPEQRQLTATEVSAAVPGEGEGPYPPHTKKFDAAAVSDGKADPEVCQALKLDTPEMRAFKKEHLVAGKGQLYLQPRDVAAPQMLVALWSFDEVYPKRFFDEAGAAIAECATHMSSNSVEDALAEWQADAIPSTPALGDQSLGVRFGRQEYDMAIDFLWVRSGHNLINVRMRSGYQDNNEKLMSSYVQGVLDDLEKTP